MGLPSITGRAVYVLTKPWDSYTAECLGVYASKREAEAKAKDIERYGDDMGHKVERVIVEEHFIE